MSVFGHLSVFRPLNYTFLFQNNFFTLDSCINPWYSLYKLNSCFTAYQERLRDWPDDARQPAGNCSGANSSRLAAWEIRGGHLFAPLFSLEKRIFYFAEVDRRCRHGTKGIYFFTRTSPWSGRAGVGVFK